MNPQSFPGRMLNPLDELARELLEQKQYGRLRMVSELLAAFSRGAWDQIEEEVKRRLVEQMEQDFHVRAWDDWDWADDNALLRIVNLIAIQKKAMGKS